MRTSIAHPQIFAILKFHLRNDETARPIGKVQLNRLADCHEKSIRQLRVSATPRPLARATEKPIKQKETDKVER